jgi:hypothetical protein
MASASVAGTNAQPEVTIGDIGVFNGSFELLGGVTDPRRGIGRGAV